MTETVAEILNAYRDGALTPEAIVARSFARIRAHGDPAIFIALREEADVLAEARALARKGDKTLPLYGIPVAVKDNIDVKGLGTTAGCPAFSYRPGKDATCVARLREAGALILGKTNLDQFATGLVGVRSPYGVPRNLFDQKLIPGGSSSGSAIAVAAGLTPLALGTDTAGSGRVPAAFSNIVGLKPSRGLISAAGVVPACRTLDCVSVLALTVDDAMAMLAVIAGADAADPFSRPRPLHAVGPMPNGLRVGVPIQGQRLFFGDRAAEAAYEAALARLAGLGAKIVEIDIEPFYAAARLLYDGPWVAERYLTARSLIASAPESLHPVTLQVILAGAHGTAAEAFAAFYQLEELRRVCDHTFRAIDALALPTAPTIYTIAEVLADPIGLNSRLGTYTNFVNLLDLCGLAVPAAMRPDGTPFGVTLLAPAGEDAALAALGREFHHATGLSLGALKHKPPPLARRAGVPAAGEIPLAVVGAHLSGLPLNGELRAAGARLIERAATAPHYRLYALSGTKPAKPGLLRVKKGAGAAIEVEVWALTQTAFGRFVAAVPPPLSIGTLELSDGRRVKGFLVEAEAVAGARDISSFGGWRAFVAQAEATV
ncbi:MAG TPA: allophanate hydrolase [Xanthobacteraceae bacterium]|nr:allophanate hydrolase [Xanthobacteraceae bacterium]